MLRNKVVVPVLAIVLAVVSAFATVKPAVFAQQGWYDSNGTTAGGGLQVSITTPLGNSPVCSVDATRNVCKILVGGVQYNAFNSQTNAEMAGGTGINGLLKYN